MFIKAQYDGNDVLLNTNCILDIWDYDKFGLKAKAFTINRDVYHIEKAELGKLIKAEQTEPQQVTSKLADTVIPTDTERGAWDYKGNGKWEQTEPQPCEWCKFYDGENCFSQEPCKVMLYFKDEPQTDCAWK